eukprot:6214025-Pleurochrysis_carterae.AAC.12
MGMDVRRLGMRTCVLRLRLVVGAEQHHVEGWQGLVLVRSGEGSKRASSLAQTSYITSVHASVNEIFK